MRADGKKSKPRQRDEGDLLIHIFSVRCIGLASLSLHFILALLLSINLREGQKPLHIICASRGFEFLCQHLSSPRCKRFPPKIIKACRLQLDFQAQPLVIPSSYLHKGRIACVLIFQSITTYHNTISNIFPLADVGS